MNIKNPLLKAVYANEANLLEQVKSLITEGANPNECTKYFETPLRVSSRNGRFDVVKYLFSVDADPEHLKWTPLFHAVAYGSVEETIMRIFEGYDLAARDTWERTPFLLSMQTGSIEKAQILLDQGASLNDKGRCEQPAWEYAIQMDDADMLAWLITKGIDYESYNSFGNTPLIEAAQCGAVKCVKCLLTHGADVNKKDRSQFSQSTTISKALTQEIAEILLAAGADFSQISSRLRSDLLQIDSEATLSVSEDEYQSQKFRVFGKSNPELCNRAFWYNMLRCNAGAWTARKHFNETTYSEDEPIWCYERYGKSITPLGNDEYIEIAGEHEGSYDPDFCIYNEVFHHKGNGVVSIYQYPENIFPPTDFHTVTLVDKFIYIIGNLGYPKNRRTGFTPVFRLNIETFVIEEVETTGNNPGWIYNHSAELIKPEIIRIEGGLIVGIGANGEVHEINKSIFELNLKNFEWINYERSPELTPFFPEEYKQFDYSDRALLSMQDGDQWRLLKIINVYRIDVIPNQPIRMEEENLIVTKDDFLYVVAYTTSSAFKCIDEIKECIAKNEWPIEIPLRCCRTTNFPTDCRYQGFADVKKDEMELFKEWKLSFERGEKFIL
ncbi:MAG: ankyrin repeat domain-containing protein [Pseudomonadota bacterium]